MRHREGRRPRRSAPGRTGGPELSNREFIYRTAYELGRHVIGYEVQKVLAAVDWSTRETHGRPVGVIGWGDPLGPDLAGQPDEDFAGQGGVGQDHGHALGWRVGSVLDAFDGLDDHPVDELHLDRVLAASATVLVGGLAASRSDSSS